MNPMDERNARQSPPSTGGWAWVAIAWLLVSAPLAWGIWTTLQKVPILFR
jgi:hypothetical protein